MSIAKSASIHASVGEGPHFTAVLFVRATQTPPGGWSRAGSGFRGAIRHRHELTAGTRVAVVCNNDDDRSLILTGQNQIVAMNQFRIRHAAQNRGNPLSTEAANALRVGGRIVGRDRARSPFLPNRRGKSRRPCQTRLPPP